jgi:hypothetical protein
MALAALALVVIIIVGGAVIASGTNLLNPLSLPFTILRIYRPSIRERAGSRSRLVRSQTRDTIDDIIAATGGTGTAENIHFISEPFQTNRKSISTPPVHGC